VSDFRRRRKAIAVLGIVNTAGVPAAIYMPFIPNANALVLATIYAILCFVVFLLHVQAGYRATVSDAQLREEFERTRILRRPLLVSISIPLLLGSFGFYFASFAIAGSYTYVAGAESEERLTVSTSHWSTGKYGNCYETRFLEQFRVFQVTRALCLPHGFKVGDQARVAGKVSVLGVFASRVARADS
jgi:hypothetical protein